MKYTSLGGDDYTMPVFAEPSQNLNSVHVRGDASSLKACDSWGIDSAKWAGVEWNPIRALCNAVVDDGKR